MRFRENQFFSLFSELEKEPGGLKYVTYVYFVFGVKRINLPHIKAHEKFLF